MEQTQIDQACRTAEEFTELYYDSVDRKRHLISRLYMDTAVLVWNGNGTTGKEEIQKFFAELPTSSHTYSCFDSQQIPGSAVGNKLAYVIKTAGNVSFQGRQARLFQQNFIITAEGDKWKIVSDCFRFQEPVP